MFDTSEFTFNQACSALDAVLDAIFVLIERDFIEFAD